MLFLVPFYLPPALTSMALVHLLRDKLYLINESTIRFRHILFIYGSDNSFGNHYPNESGWSLVEFLRYFYCSLHQICINMGSSPDDP